MASSRVVTDTGSIYCPLMTAPQGESRGLDEVAVHAQLQRLARASEPPWLHREVARRMAERLAIIRLQPAVVLDWWSWLGGGATLLAQAYPRSQRIAIEPSVALRARSEAARKRPWWSVQRWQGAMDPVRLDREALPDRVGLVWANMVLHGVFDPPALFARWQATLAVDGFVMFSCLGPGTLRELRALYARLGWPAPTPTFIDMHDLGDMLVQAGFADPVMDQEVLTLSWDSPQALLAELRTLGGNTSPARLPGLRTPRWRDRLLQELQTLAGPDGKPRLSIEVAYGHAFRAAPRLRPGETTQVSLEDMRAMVRAGRTKPVR
jgi:malonyl-CoA O-methyltransferase